MKGARIKRFVLEPVIKNKALSIKGRRVVTGVAYHSTVTG